MSASSIRSRGYALGAAERSTPASWNVRARQPSSSAITAFSSRAPVAGRGRLQPRTDARDVLPAGALAQLGDGVDARGRRAERVEHRPVPVVDAGLACHPGPQALAPGRIGRQRIQRQSRGPHLGQHHPGEAVEDVFLAREVLVERHPRAARQAGDRSTLHRW